jgi:neutral ceramidase
MKSLNFICKQPIKHKYLIILMLLCPFLTHAQTKVFKAGASTANITPRLGQGIVGNFGTPPPANHVHDELLARCLILDDGERKLAFVISDNVGIKREVFDEAKKYIQDETGIPYNHVMLAVSHTHSGVSAGGTGEKRRGWNQDSPLDDYQMFLARRIADAVRIALNNLEPAQIAWGAGSVPQHVFNRRWIMKEKVVNPYGEKHQVLFNPGHNNPNKVKQAGPVDPEVSFISVQSTNGRPIALLANYSIMLVGCQEIIFLAIILLFLQTEFRSL